MRVQVLGLNAFGPFSGKRIDLSPGDQGLHIIYGPNEAGKSTALRALISFFYGIPDRTADDFLHEKSQLRIGMSLRHSNGSELVLVRRKGRKNTLLDEDGKAVTEEILKKYLGGVSEELFPGMFGLDHNALMRGGEEILKGGGDVGESLFSAGMGGVSLHAVLDDLDNEARALYTDRGKLPCINAAISRYKEAKAEVKRSAVSSQQFRELDKAVKEATKKEEQAAANLKQLEREKHRLERLKEALPILSERQDLLISLEKQQRVILLPPDFVEQRHSAVHSLNSAREREKRALTDLKRIEDKIQGLTVPEKILQNAETIEDIFVRLGNHRKAVSNDMPRLKGEKEQLESDAMLILRELRPGLELENAGEIRLSSLQRAAMQELGTQYQSTIDRVKRWEEEVKKQEQRLLEARRELAQMKSVRDSGVLRHVIADARKKGDLEGEMREVATRLQAVETGAGIGLNKLGCWSGPLDRLESLPVPALETLDRFHEAAQEQKSVFQRGNEKILLLEESSHELDRQIKELNLVGAVPSEGDLERGRKKRDRLWALVRRAWLKKEEISEEITALAPDHVLPEAYEGAVRQSDEVADRLRREESRVTKQAQFIAQKEKCLKALVEKKKERDLLLKEKANLEQEWKACWHPLGITPLSPLEMRSWLQRHDKLVLQAGDIRELRNNLAGLQKQIEEYRGGLIEILEGLGVETINSNGTLESLLDEGQEILESIEESARRRKHLCQAVEDMQKGQESAEREQEEARKGLEHWQAQWRDAVRALNLGQEATPAQVLMVLDKTEEFFRKIDKADDFGRRINGILRDARLFETDVQQLVKDLAQEFGDLQVEQAASQLNTKLNAAREDAAKLKEFNENRNDQEDVVAMVRNEIQIATKRLEELCQKADCKEQEELEGKEHLSEKKRKEMEQLERLESHLHEFCQGASINDLVEEARRIDADAIGSRLAEIEDQIKEYKKERDSLLEMIGSEKNQLSAMDGSAKAAEADMRAQSALAQIRDGTERYIRLRLARNILQQEIERYREENQDPLLARASTLFSRLTLGSFSGLQTDFNEKDNPVLLGVRPAGQKVTVEGMSDGTRDQLFLSLRLAGLEKYLKDNEPIPLIVDDLLINFDDQRSEATLKVLGEFARQTQVIFFTHHSRLLELAERSLPRGDVYFKSLEQDQKIM